MTTKPDYRAPNAKLILRADAFHADWLATRTTGLGGSDVAYVVGASKYKSPFSLWQEKTGRVEPDKLTIYPLAIDKVPGPDHWMNAPRGKANPLPNNPKLIAVKPIDVRLIENPLV